MTSPDPAPDPATAELERIRERAKAAADFPLAEFAKLIDHDTRTVGGWIPASAMDVPRLLGAVERLSKLADDWEHDAAELDCDIVRARRSPHSSDHHQARTDEAVAGQLRDHAADLREAITSALTGKETSDGA